MRTTTTADRRRTTNRNTQNNRGGRRSCASPLRTHGLPALKRRLITLAPSPALFRLWLIGKADAGRGAVSFASRSAARDRFRCFHRAVRLDDSASRSRVRLWERSCPIRLGRTRRSVGPGVAFGCFLRRSGGWRRRHRRRRILCVRRQTGRLLSQGGCRQQREEKRDRDRHQSH